MDKVIVTAMLIIGAVTAATVVIVTIGPSISSSSQSVVESQGEAADRIRTSIEVIAVAADSDGTRVDVWVKNVGIATIGAIDKSDVFLIQSGTRFDAITYNSSGGTKTWTGDLKENGTSWSRGDTLHIQIDLSADAVADDTDHILKISTPNGVTAQKTFSR